ncbi:MAG: hypothetical protein BroJett015_02630 [Chloroflexota bacterium]|nr:MAG: hypothetical protein BroJett015_02630 [Chloroflexota bacterium]
MFQAGNLGIAVTHGDGKLKLGITGAAAELFEQVAKSGETFQGKRDVCSSHMTPF